MRSVDEILNEVLALPNASRVLLAKKLVESLDLNEGEMNVNETIQRFWITEAKKRRDEIRNGSVKPILGEEALARVRQQLLES
ncbi:MULTISPECIES: addiction module protein [Spirulina sp. CCY15215]|uniref:addiction module protein n=1 Tax=Spirulina sp. CCY15215 TaxID=2767591 RepID=UPI0032AF2998